MAFSTAFAATTAVAWALGPRIDPSSVKMEQPFGATNVVVTYVLRDAPGIVTLDVQTNRTGAATSDEADWVSIGGMNVQNLEGDVNRIIETDGQHAIVWHAFDSWPGHKKKDGSARAVVTVWATNSPPDYLVVDLTQDSHVRYYTTPEFLPHGGLTNIFYKREAIVMRRIHAQGVEWRMGSLPGQFNAQTSEAMHDVILTNDYYIGVFMLTQGQIAKFAESSGKDATSPYYWINSILVRQRGSYACEGYEDPTNAAPCMGLSYDVMRGDSCSWPADRHRVVSTRWLGRARAKTGVDFDLPTEAQWEFAARGGTTTVVYSRDYTVFEYSYRNALDSIAWYGQNKQYDRYPVGLKRPNAFGLYDVIGNGMEICLDWYAADYGGLGGKFEPEGPSSGSARAYRSTRTYESFYATRSARRNGGEPTPVAGYDWGYCGVRLVCPLSLTYPDGEK